MWCECVCWFVCLNYESIHNLYGLSLQSGECFGCVGNSSDRLRDKLVSLGLGRSNGHVGWESDALIACLHTSDSVGGLISVISPLLSASSAGDFSSCACSTLTVGGVGSFLRLLFN